MKKIIHNISILNERKALLGNTCIVFIVSTISALSAAYFSEFARSPVKYWENDGAYPEVITFILLSYLYIYGCNLKGKSIGVRLVKHGLLIWISGAVINLMDEIFIQPRWISHYIEDPLLLFGMLMNAIGISMIISRINKESISAHFRSITDELTQLPNRRYFMSILKEKNDSVVGLIILDIDFFKKINDVYGHAVGDDVLSSLGELLSRYKNEKITPARIGGEEFAVIVDDTNVRKMEFLAQSIQNESRTIRIAGKTSLSISMGVGVRARNEQLSAFMKEVDDALYQAKKNGRGRIEWRNQRNFMRSIPSTD